MENRIDKKFRDLKNRKKTAFIAFITAGDPSLKTTAELVYAFEKIGVDIVELGVPFSDPLADGPTIQAASQRALKKNVNISKIFNTVKSIRRKTDIPIALMTYYNPVFHFRESRFVEQCRLAGVDGLIIPDLPPEEAGPYIQACRRNHLSSIFFLSPATHKNRMSRIIKASSGFIYYVSLTGVTGERSQLSKDLKKSLTAARHMSHKPVCVGFGISTPRQVKEIGKYSDGVIVGSAIVKEIYKHRRDSHLVKKVSDFVSRLAEAV